MKNPVYPDFRRQAAAALTFLLIFSALAAPTLAGGETRLDETASGDLYAVLLLKEAPLVAMTRIPFELQLTDAAGTPLAGASVRCDLSMPAMAMPINRPAVTEKGGSFRGEAIFTMAGAWRATFEILLPNGEAKTLTFDLDRVLLK